MSSELKPCPFCGGKNSHSDKCFIALLAERVTWWATDERELNEAWNQRAERTCRRVRTSGNDHHGYWYECNMCQTPMGEFDSYCSCCGAKVEGD